MSLRTKAVEIEAERKRDKSKIGALIEAHPKDADDIRDLLLGEPRIPHSIAARTLTDVFNADPPITDSDVTYWRKVNA